MGLTGAAHWKRIRDSGASELRLFQPLVFFFGGYRPSVLFITDVIRGEQKYAATSRENRQAPHW